MKILFIHNKYRQHGGEDVAVELETSLLKERGHEVELLLFSNDEASANGALRSAINAVYNRAAVKKVRQAIQHFGPAIVHVHNWFFAASPSIFYAAKKEGVPVVMTIHNYRFVCANALLLRNEQPCELCVNKTWPLDGIRYKCYHNSTSQTAMVTAVTGIYKTMGTWQKKIDNYIVLTPFAKSRLVGSSFKADPHKLIIKPNFIPDPGEGNPVREDFFLFAGRVSIDKGVHILAKAFSQTNLKLVIAGEGPEKDVLQRQYANASNITFAGRQNRAALLDMMKRCKAVIFPSLWYEGLPFVILEAFATATPVIASKLGNMAEVITHAVNGYHFTPGDAMELQSAAEAMDRGGTQVQQLYGNARQTYLEKYHPDIHYKSILSIYEKTIANSSKVNA